MFKSDRFSQAYCLWLFISISLFLRKGASDIDTDYCIKNRKVFPRCESSSFHKR
jgi:hypothetical protein